MTRIINLLYTLFLGIQFFLNIYAQYMKSALVKMDICHMWRKRLLVKTIVDTILQKFTKLLKPVQIYYINKAFNSRELFMFSISLWKGVDYVCFKIKNLHQ